MAGGWSMTTAWAVGVLTRAAEETRDCGLAELEEAGREAEGEAECRGVDVAAGEVAVGMGEAAVGMGVLVPVFSSSESEEKFSEYAVDFALKCRCQEGIVCEIPIFEKKRTTIFLLLRQNYNNISSPHVDCFEFLNWTFFGLREICRCVQI